MEIAIALFVGVITGFFMGRVHTDDKEKVKEGKPLSKIVQMPKKEPEPSEFELGLDNLLSYDGTEQGDER